MRKNKAVPPRDRAADAVALTLEAVRLTDEAASYRREAASLQPSQRARGRIIEGIIQRRDNDAEELLAELEALLNFESYNTAVCDILIRREKAPDDETQGDELALSDFLPDTPISDLFLNCLE